MTEYKAQLTYRGIRLSSRWQGWIRWLAFVRLLLENTCPCLAQLLLAVALIATGQTEITQSQFVPPHMFLVIFLAAVPAQLLFGVAMMTMPAVLTILTFGLLYGSGVILSVFLLDAIGAPKRWEFPPGCSNLEGLARGDPSLEGGTGFQRDGPPMGELPIVLRGSKGPVTERDPAALVALGCERGWGGLGC